MRDALRAGLAALLLAAPGLASAMEPEPAAVVATPVVPAVTPPVSPAVEPPSGMTAEEYERQTGYHVSSASPSPLLQDPVRVTVGMGEVAPVTGYTPVRIHLENRVQQPWTVSLGYTGNEGGQRVTREVELGSGESRTVILPVPVTSSGGQVRVNVGGIAAESVNVWFERASRRAVLFAGNAEKLPSYLGRPASERGAGGVSVSHFAPEELPDELSGYLGFDAVLIGPGLVETLTQAQQRALESYAATGGELILFDPSPLKTVELKDRKMSLFDRGGAALKPFPLLSIGTVPGWSSYGLGTLVLCSTTVNDRHACDRILDRADEHRPRVTPNGATSKSRRYMTEDRYGASISADPLLSQARAPVGRFLLILAVFSLLVGPGSVILARRRGPALLLVTIPGTALVTCVLIVAYSLLVDGFATHARLNGYTLLDRGRERAITVGLGAFYANLAPGPLQLSAQSALVFPSAETTQYASVDWTRGGRFGADFIGSRNYREWGFAQIVPSRARLVVKRDGDGYRVQNALGGKVSQVSFQLKGQGYSASDIPENGEAVAHVEEGDLAAKRMPDGTHGPYSRFSDGARVHLGRPLQDGHFVAVLEGQGPLAFPGLQLLLEGSSHVVRGEVE